MDGIKVTKTPAVLFRLGHRLEGVLHLMRHHMVFKAAEREIWICYPVIAETTRCGNQIRIVCKDFMFVGFEFSSGSDCRLAFETIEELRSVRSIDQLYAFVYSPATVEKDFNGWSLYDPEREYRRMGAIGPDAKWRLSSANKHHKVCPTYPRLLVVPSVISDNVMAYAAKYRSKGRLPVLSYYLSLNNCTISRCSQPLVGLKQARSMQDEAIIAAIWGTNESPSGLRGAQADHLVVDLRPSTNALAQVALGGGSENMDRYRPARKVYMGVDNLHVMRDSLFKVRDALRHSDVGDEPPNPHSLDRSQWLKHIALLVESSRTVVQQVYFKCSHVVVHCSDGWDRTPQITSLAMISLDPYYRTFEGFMVLIEKEWVSFGHQFALRSDLVNKKGYFNSNSDSEGEENDILKNVTSFLTETTKGRQDGPIFQQFLDTVYQLLVLFPNTFEFNERLLRRLMYHTYAGQYGTFLFDTERDAIAQEASVRTRSVWDYFLARQQQFINPLYQREAGPDHHVLIVPSDWKPRWWSGQFGRIDADMNDKNAWRARPVKNQLGGWSAQKPHTPSAGASNSSSAPSSSSSSPSTSTLINGGGMTSGPAIPTSNSPAALETPDVTHARLRSLAPGAIGDKSSLSTSSSTADSGEPIPTLNSTPVSEPNGSRLHGNEEMIFTSSSHVKASSLQRTEEDLQPPIQRLAVT